MTKVRGDGSSEQGGGSGGEGKWSDSEDIWESQWNLLMDWPWGVKEE